MSGRPITTRTRMAIAAAVIAGKQDQHIANEFGVARSSVERVRKERDLSANFGPGRPTREEKTP
ncbi:hypothetical protein ACTJKO_07775 [Curtobacterium sp. 22159]|uniref:hypothetical protein n=1 Tax=Curtobacterium sp. 22159 TaxID=3453882 RepID=UPI003F849837